MFLAQNNAKAIKSIFPPSMYEKYGVTNKNKAPQKKIKLASNENIISNSTKIGAFHLKNP